MVSKMLYSFTRMNEQDGERVIDCGPNLVKGTERGMVNKLRGCCYEMFLCNRAKADAVVTFQCRYRKSISGRS